MKNMGFSYSFYLTLFTLFFNAASENQVYKTIDSMSI